MGSAGNNYFFKVVAMAIVVEMPIPAAVVEAEEEAATANKHVRLLSGCDSNSVNTLSIALND